MSCDNPNVIPRRPDGTLIDAAANFVDLGNKQTVPLSNGTITAAVANPTTERIESTGHGLSDGDAVHLSTTGTMPTGLEDLDDDGDEVIYWVINATANDFQLASTHNGTSAVDIEDAGAGTLSYQVRGQFVGTFLDTRYLGSVLYLPFAATPIALAQSEWSADGVTADTGLLATSAVTIEQTSGFYVGLAVVNTFVNRYWRTRIVNGPTNQSLFGAFPFVSREVYQGSFAGLESNLSLLSTALLTRSVIAGRQVDGSFVNIEVDREKHLVASLGNARASAEGSIFTQATRDDVAIDFSLSDSLLLLDDESVGGTATLDAANGQVVFDSGAPVGQSAVFRSSKSVIYEPGHTIRAEMTLQVDTALTGDQKVEWGLGDANDGLFFQADTDGIRIIRKRNGVIEETIEQADWNGDQLLGSEFSNFLTDGSPVSLDISKNNLYRIDYEWLGAAPIHFYVLAPSGQFMLVHTIEYPNNHTGSSISQPDLPLFVHADNGTTGSSVVARSGSWVGRIYTGKVTIAGLTPNELPGEIRIPGRHEGNGTTVPLVGDDTWRGDWFQWQEAYSGLALECRADVAGTLLIDFSTVALPVDGVDTDIIESRSYVYPPPGRTLGDILKKHVPVQSRWVRLRYINGPSAQGEFQIDCAFLTTPPPEEASPVFVPPEDLELSGLERVNLFAKDPASSTDFIGRGGAGLGLDVHVMEHEVSTPIRPVSTLKTGQSNVSSTGATILPASPLTDRATVRYTNLDDTINIFFSEAEAKLTEQADVILPLSSIELDLKEGQQIFFQIEDQGGITNNLTLSPDTVDSNVGWVNPNNVFASDETRAICDDAADAMTVSGFPATASKTLDDVQTVTIGVEGRKAASPVSETVAYIDTVTGQGGDVVSVSTGTVTSNAEHFYLAAVSFAETTGSVTGVSGLGLTWTQLQAGTGSDAAISVWVGSGTPTGDGLVTASFSTPAINCVIAVSRFSGVDSVEDSAIANGSGSSVSVSATGTNLGMAVTFVASERRSSTPGPGFTEQNEVATGATPDSASVATNTKPITVTGSQPYTGTLSGSTGWAAVEVALLPQTINPTVTVTPKISGVPTGSVLIAELSTTTDAAYELDITADRAWTYADLDALTLDVEVSDIGSVQGEVDHVYIEVIESQAGNLARISWSEVGGIL